MNSLKAFSALGAQMMDKSVQRQRAARRPAMTFAGRVIWPSSMMPKATPIEIAHQSAIANVPRLERP